VNYRRFIWALPFLTWAVAVQAVEMEEECLDEPVFNGRVCVYQANREAGKSIFLIHGIGDNASRDWNRQLSVLSPDFRIITFDLPGFGRSEQGDKHYSPEKYVALIDFIAGHYAVPRFDLIGHSMGAAVSILYAAKFKHKVRRLMVIDVAGILHRLAIGKYVIAGEINGDAGDTNRAESYVVKIIEKFERLFSFISNDIAEQSEHARAGIELVDYDFGAALDEVEAPTLIVWGEKDRIAPMRTAKVLDYRIKNSRLKVIKGAGHLSMVDRSEEFNPILMGFLQSAEADRIVASSEGAITKETGRCNGATGVIFSGEYDRIEIKNCSDVTIKDARVGELDVFESRVVVEDSRVGGEVAVAVRSVGSDIKITTSSLIGNVAIESARSRFDLAAVDLYAKNEAVIGESRSRFVFSVCRVYRGAEKKNLHESVTLNKGDSIKQKGI
jgi:pimeloyl-ACP methyl ester carboxylesterase